jgi:HEAT repeat protein
MYRPFSLVLILALLSPRPGFARDTDPPDTKKPPVKVAGKTIHEWLADMRNPDPSIRRDAIQAVQYFGPYSAPSVPMLVWTLNNDADSTLRTNAAIVLMNVSVDNKDVPSVVKALKEQVRSLQVALRYHCVVTLGRFQEEAADAIPVLVSASTDQTSWEIRQAACASLFQVGNDPKKGPDTRAVAALINALRDPASKVRLEAVMSLATLGKIENPDLRIKMLQALQMRLKDREMATVVWAYFGLMVNSDQGNKVYLDALVRLLKTGDVPTKIQTLRALGLLKRDALPVLKDMIAALQDEDPFVKGTACAVLAEMKESVDTSGAVDAIKKIIADEKTPRPLKNHAEDCLAKIQGRKAARPDDKK